MEAAWGFHVSLEALAKVASIWQHLRTFRLAKARHGTELGTRLVANLASLPQEVIGIIEKEIITNAYNLVSAKEPFLFPCYYGGRYCEMLYELHASEQFKAALEIFKKSYVHIQVPASTQGDGDDGDDEDGQAPDAAHWQAFDAFMETSEYDNLKQAYLPIHQSENPCVDYFEAHDGFWKDVGICVSSGYPSVEFTRPFKDGVESIVEVVFQFVKDFGLSMIVVPYCNQGDCEECPPWEDDDQCRMQMVSLTFKGTGGCTVDKASKITSLEATHFDSVRFSRFIKLFHFSPEGYPLKNMSYLEARWMVYKTQPGCQVDPIKLQMTVEEVEEF